MGSSTKGRLFPQVSSNWGLPQVVVDESVTPGYEDIVGMAWVNAAVSVISGGATNGTLRQGEYYRCELALGNGSGPVWQAVTVNASGATQSGSVLFPPNTQNPVHDLDGNLLSDGLWTNAWDGENRLIRMESVAGVSAGGRKKLEFGYDHQGRRVWRKISHWNGGGWVQTNGMRFVYDGWNLVAELNEGNNQVVRSYLWGSDLSGTMEGAGGIGGLLAVKDHGSGVVHFAGYDGSGNVVGLVNSADQSLSAQYEYGPFGETVRATGPMAKANPFGFSTKYTDRETEWIYYGMRYYRPDWGRWVNRDPIEEEGGIHLYGFVGNSPVNGIDPLGMNTLAEEETAAGTAAGLEGAGGNTMAMGFRQMVKKAVQNFSDFQEIAYNIWDIADAIGLPNADDLLMDALHKGNQAFSNDLTSFGKKAGADWELHHVGTNKGKHGWNSAFKSLFGAMGLDTGDASNLLAVPGHKGRHTTAYHTEVFTRPLALTKVNPPVLTRSDPLG